MGTGLPNDSQVTDVISTSAALYRRGWMEGAAGNVSVRRAGGNQDRRASA
jgi:ribulose-5-phosphate 4-epimerase/fuculose-1-phosphate aldolase